MTDIQRIILEDLTACSASGSPFRLKLPSVAAGPKKFHLPRADLASGALWVLIDSLATEPCSRKRGQRFLFARDPLFLR